METLFSKAIITVKKSMDCFLYDTDLRHEKCD